MSSQTQLSSSSHTAVVSAFRRARRKFPKDFGLYGFKPLAASTSDEEVRKRDLESKCCNEQFTRHGDFQSSSTMTEMVCSNCRSCILAVAGKDDGNAESKNTEKHKIIAASRNKTDRNTGGNLRCRVTDKENMYHKHRICVFERKSSNMTLLENRRETTNNDCSYDEDEGFNDFSQNSPIGKSKLYPHQDISKCQLQRRHSLMMPRCEKHTPSKVPDFIARSPSNNKLNSCAQQHQGYMCQNRRSRSLNCRNPYHCVEYFADSKQDLNLNRQRTERRSRLDIYSMNCKSYNERDSSVCNCRRSRPFCHSLQRMESGTRDSGFMSNRHYDNEEIESDSRHWSPRTMNNLDKNIGSNVADLNDNVLNKTYVCGCSNNVSSRSRNIAVQTLNNSVGCDDCCNIIYSNQPGHEYPCFF